jgi:hypothetical protein
MRLLPPLISLPRVLFQSSSPRGLEPLPQCICLASSNLARHPPSDTITEALRLVTATSYEHDLRQGVIGKIGVQTHSKPSHIRVFCPYQSLSPRKLSKLKLKCGARQRALH